MRRLFESFRGPARQDGLAATDFHIKEEEEDLPHEARAAYRKAEKARTGPPRKQALYWAGVPGGFNRRTGERNRCYTCGSEYHLAPRCTQRRQWRPDGAPSSPPAKQAPRSSVPSIRMDTLASACTERTQNPRGGGGQCEESFSTTSEAGSQLICKMDYGVVISNARATANLVCFRRLKTHSSMLGKIGLPRVPTYPIPTRFKFGDSRMYVLQRK